MNDNQQKPPVGFDHTQIEKKWQEKWEKEGLYRVADRVERKENFYQLVEFSYPSGNLHTGHWYAFSVPDIFARYKRMRGYNVLYPMGFDAFGLPAENAAIKLGADPKVWTYEQMEKMRIQLRSMGAMFDWSREVVTCAPEYYKWTQWMFNQFLKHDLVYRANTKVNWCPKDKTILANEQVVDGTCERCGSEVEQRDQDQWMLRITKYADRLVDDLEGLAWPHAIKEAQKNWIGRSDGSEIDFKIEGSDEKITVFTTRADTLFGVTYVVLAPEHQLVESLKSKVTSEENRKEIESYVQQSKKKSELDRQQSKEKTGVQIQGIKAVNPANGELVPVWIADYVLAGYGTGAVMAVPAHDERDFEFANTYNLPIKQVVVPENAFKSIAVAPTLQNAEEFKQQLKEASIIFELAVSAISGREHIRVSFSQDKLDTFIGLVQGQITGTNWVEVVGTDSIVIQKDSVQHGLLDNAESWFEKFSGWEPFVRGQKNLWDMLGKNSFLREFVCYVDYGILRNSEKFDGLTSEEAKKKITEFVGGKIVSTYRLRDWGISRQRYWGCPIPIVYDPQGNAHPVPDEYLPWILPTDVDHTPDGTAPLARSKELFERTEKLFGKGWTPEVETMDTFVDSTWYFYRYLDNTNTTAFAKTDALTAWMPIDLYMGGAEHTTMHVLYSRFWTKALYDIGFVNESEAFTVRRNRGLILGPDGNKMSKSKGNVVNPDEIVERLGADTVRMYLAFMGPYGTTANYPWDPNGVVGVRRFLERVWKLQTKISDSPAVGLDKKIKKMTEDIEDHKYNTAISQMMIVLNEWDALVSISREDYKTFLRLLAPFAPHITEELWSSLGEAESIHLAPWPTFDESKTVDAEVTIAIQINGKVRGSLVVGRDESEESIKEKAFALPQIAKYLESQEIKKVVYIAGKIISVVL
jgi:leucyl-tRNA synthetase